MNKIYLDEEKEDTKKIAAPDALAEKFPNVIANTNIRITTLFS